MRNLDWLTALVSGQHSAQTGFLANVWAEVTHQVMRASHHPSVALWLSNNEITAGTGKKDCLVKGGRSCWEILFLDTIMDAIVAVDRSRPLWPYSHSDGARHAQIIDKHALMNSSHWHKGHGLSSPTCSFTGRLELWRGPRDQPAQQ